MSKRAVVGIQHGPVPPEKQAAACLAYLETVGYDMAGLVKHPDLTGAADMIAVGNADVLVVAYGGHDIAPIVANVGGRVEAVHPSPHVVQPPRTEATVHSLIVRLWRKLRSVGEVADLVGEQTGEIRRVLRSAGISLTNGQKKKRNQ